MKYQDKVFGGADISEPVILELINSPVLERLKGVDNAGYFDPCWFPGTSFSRFEHSLGVYLLLNKYKAPLEEQVAGLIHDVSHTVFSHCADYAFLPGQEKEQLFQDSVFDEFVRHSEIPQILKHYGIDLEYILNEKNFPLKENLLPDLCADRIDYSLRTAAGFKILNQEGVNRIFESLTTENNSWVFKDFKTAKEFAEMFFKLNKEYYSGLPSAVMLKTTGECLKYSLSKGYIGKDDLYSVDKKVLEKIAAKTQEDRYLKLLFDRMNNRIPYEENKTDYDFHVFCKSRVVDPFFKENGEVKRVSNRDVSWEKIVGEESVAKEYFIKFLQVI